MKNDEEFFLQKLSCGILRVRRFNKIVRLRGPLHLPHESRPSSTSTNDTNTDSIPLPDISAEHIYLFSTETSPNSKYSYTLRLHLVACTHDINLWSLSASKLFISAIHMWVNINISFPLLRKNPSVSLSFTLGTNLYRDKIYKFIVSRFWVENNIHLYISWTQVSLVLYLYKLDSGLTGVIYVRVNSPSL